MTKIQYLRERYAEVASDEELNLLLIDCLNAFEVSEKELDRKTKDYNHLIEQHMPRTADGCDPGWSRVIEAREFEMMRPIGCSLRLILEENVKMKAELAALGGAALPVVLPEGLHPETKKLVSDFVGALAEKLHKAEIKYGHQDGWKAKDWYDSCLQEIWCHMEKGDPLDVAAYCAFMWYHGWVTTMYEKAARPVVLPERLNPSYNSLYEVLGMIHEVDGDYLNRDDVISVLNTAGITVKSADGEGE